jgi:hypothetical protein
VLAHRSDRNRTSVASAACSSDLQPLISRETFSSIPVDVGIMAKLRIGGLADGADDGFLKEQMESVLGPMREHQRMLNQLMSPAALRLRDVLERQARLHERLMPQLLNADTATALLADQKKWQATIAGLMKPAFVDAETTTKAIRRQMDALRPASSALQAIDSFVRPAMLRDLERLSVLPAVSAIAKMRDITATAQPLALQAAMRRTFEELALITQTEVAVDDDLSAEPDHIALAKINEELAGVMSDITPTNLDLVMSRVFAFVRGAPKPIAKALLGMLIALFAMALEPEVQRYEPLKWTRPYVRKVMWNLFRVSIPEDQRRVYRMVTAKRYLYVRRYPRRSDSFVVGRLPFGAFVAVVRRHKDWTLIEYTAEDVTVRGWVFSRYLERGD